jgi:sortase A
VLQRFAADVAVDVVVTVTRSVAHTGDENVNASLSRFSDSDQRHLDRALWPVAWPTMFARFLSGLGKTLVSFGLLIFLFVAFQLWGTGVEESRHQQDLTDDLAKTIRIAGDSKASDSVVTTKGADGVTPDDVIASLKESGKATDKITTPEVGKPIGMIEIPKIGVKKVVVEGTDTEVLKQGPGHYVDTPYPGSLGNASIAGHRTTYGAPFNRINELNPGDLINVYTQQGAFTYKVITRPPDVPGDAGDAWWIVSPNDVEVLANTDADWYTPTAEDYVAAAAATPATDATTTTAAPAPVEPVNKTARLTLTACHPEFSDKLRIIVTAVLIKSTPAAVAPAKVKTTTDPGKQDTTSTINSDENLANAFGEAQGWNKDEIPSIAQWGAAAFGVWLVAFLIGLKVGRKRWISYLLISPAFFYCIWYLFTHINRSLPPL